MRQERRQNPWNQLKETGQWRRIVAARDGKVDAAAHAAAARQLVKEFPVTRPGINATTYVKESYEALLQLSAAFANNSVQEIIVVDAENGKKHAANSKDGMWAISAVSASALQPEDVKTIQTDRESKVPCLPTSWTNSSPS